MYLASILAGLICKWRHSKEWEAGEVRVFPIQRIIRSTAYCPRCKGDVIEERRISQEEADTWWRLGIEREA